LFEWQACVRCVAVSTLLTSSLTHPKPPSNPQASNAFNTAATGELRAIYKARGEPLLAANLGRHISNMVAMKAMKRTGDAWATDAWAQYTKRTKGPEQRGIAKAAWQRKRELGLIRPPPSQPAGAAEDDWGQPWDSGLGATSGSSGSTSSGSNKQQQSGGGGSGEASAEQTVSAASPL